MQFGLELGFCDQASGAMVQRVPRAPSMAKAMLVRWEVRRIERRPNCGCVLMWLIVLRLISGRRTATKTGLQSALLVETTPIVGFRRGKSCVDEASGGVTHRSPSCRNRWVGVSGNGSEHGDAPERSESAPADLRRPLRLSTPSAAVCRRSTVSRGR
jgi:hypothetical protein